LIALGAMLIATGATLIAPSATRLASGVMQRRAAVSGAPPHFASTSN